MGQIMPTTRDAIYACVLANTPVLYEPYFEVTITTIKEKIGTIYSCFSYKRGEIINEESDENTPVVIVTSKYQ